MANHLGREGVFKISSTTVGEIRNYALAQSSDVVEDSVIGDVFRTRRATLKTWSVNGDLVIGYLQKAIKPLNMLKAMEDSLVIYRI